MFIDADAVTPVVTHLHTTATDHQFAVIVYCVMPDHMHALIEATTDGANCREFARIFKQRTSFHWRRQRGDELWQRSYFDRVLRADEDTPGVARYILENPVRAGLAKDVLDYPFLGSGAMDIRDLIGSATP